MIAELDPKDPKEMAFAIHKAVRFSGLSLSYLCDRLKQDYHVELTPSSLSHVIHRGTIRFQRTLQIRAICGVSEVQIKGVAKRVASN